MDQEKFIPPSNSHKSKEKHVERVTTGKVIQQKPRMGKKFAESFLADEAKNVGSYIWNDVIIPALKTLFEDTIIGSLSMSLWGTNKGRGYGQNRNGSLYRDYNKVSQTQRDPRQAKQLNISSVAPRNRAWFSDIILENRGEAEEVLDRLNDLIGTYGQASMADLKDLIGETSSFTDNKYGWTDLRNASVSRVRDGFLLNLPKTEVID